MNSHNKLNTTITKYDKPTANTSKCRNTKSASKSLKKIKLSTPILLNIVIDILETYIRQEKDRNKEGKVKLSLFSVTAVMFIDLLV